MTTPKNIKKQYINLFFSESDRTGKRSNKNKPTDDYKQEKKQSFDLKE